MKRNSTRGHVHVVDAGLKSYFDTIPHDRLMELVRARVADGPVRRLLASFLAGVMATRSPRPH